MVLVRGFSPSELAPRQITVNAVAQSAQGTSNIDESQKATMAKIPLGRLGKPARYYGGC